MRTVRVALVLMLAATVVAGCTDSSGGRQGSGLTGRLGSALLVDQGSDSATVTVFELKQAKPSQYSADRVQGTLYSVNVTVVGEAGAFDPNPLYFAARTSTGLVIKEDLGGTDDQIGDDKVNVGDRVVGTVSFDVPSGQTITLIRFTTVFGDVLATWTV